MPLKRARKSTTAAARPPPPDRSELGERLRAVGLFLDVAPATLARALRNLDAAPRPREEELDDETPSRAERYWPHESIQLLRRSHGDVLLHAPQSVDVLRPLLARTKERCRAIASRSPTVKLAEVDRVQRIVRLSAPGYAVDFKWSRVCELVGLFNEALTKAGDSRRFVLLAEAEEPSRYMLVSPAQDAILAEAGLLDDYDGPRLPKPFRPPAVVVARSIHGPGRPTRAAVIEPGTGKIEVAGRPERRPDEAPIYGTRWLDSGFACVIGAAARGAACDDAMRTLREHLATTAPDRRDALPSWLGAGATSACEIDPDMDVGIAWFRGAVVTIATRGAVHGLLRRARPRARRFSEADLQSLGSPPAVVELERGDAVFLATKGLVDLLGGGLMDILLRQNPAHWSLLAMEAAKRAGGISASAAVAIAGVET